MLHTDYDYILTFCSRVVIGLANYHLKGKGFQRLDTFFPGSMVNELEGHLACTYGLEAEDFPAARTYKRRLTCLGWLELRLVDMRHQLQHDKPEPENDYSTERVEKVLKWQKRLIPLVGKDALVWLPCIRSSEEKMDFQIGGEPPIMKFMKYPVAKWAIDVTREITQEMSDMLFKYQGRRKIVKDLTTEELVATVDKRLTKEKDLNLWRLWQAGE